MKIARILAAAALLLAAAASLASGPRAVLKRAESSMLVTGSIDIEPNGSVGAATLDHREKLPGGVVALVDQAIPGWRFEPVRVDGKAVRARARMTLRVVARKVGDGYRIGIRNASFGDGDAPGGISARDMAPPAYPFDALRMGVSGTVYLVLRVGRQGRVEDVVAEQVNLAVYGSDLQMKRVRDLLARSAVSNARRWTFNPPTEGEDVDDEYWALRVPVEYQLLDGPSAPDPDAEYGHWDTYIPGPRHPAPWVHDRTAPGNDALVAGRIQQVGRELRLLVPAGEG